MTVWQYYMWCTTSRMCKDFRKAFAFVIIAVLLSRCPKNEVETKKIKEMRKVIQRPTPMSLLTTARHGVITCDKRKLQR